MFKQKENQRTCMLSCQTCTRDFKVYTLYGKRFLTVGENFQFPRVKPAIENHRRVARAFSIRLNGL